MIEPTPAFPVVRVRDVKLRARVADRRVGARERHPRFHELIAAKESEAVGERLLIDPVDADHSGQSARHLRDRLRLPRIEPADGGGETRGQTDRHGGEGQR